MERYRNRDSGRSSRRDDSSSGSNSHNRKRSKDSERDRHRKRKKDKRNKKNRRSSSESSSTSSSSGDESSLLTKLQANREQLLQQKKKKKEMLKANEAPEEKRLRRLLKKEAKERRRKERMGWDKEYLHYTNSDNPFGDSNILSTFVWTKKLAKEGLTGCSREELERINRAKQAEMSVELEKVKGRRMEREREREAREAAMAAAQREREAAQFDSWQRQEDRFHLDQARLRSNIRIADGRAKPIDLLAKYINSEEEVDTVEMHEPYTYLNGLSLNDLEDLIEDIKVYMELERGRNLDYWQDITVIVEDELYRLRKSGASAVSRRREGIHESVTGEVATVLKGKTTAQLAQLQIAIEARIRDKPEGTDIAYWESLLSQLKGQMARARLRDRHQENLKKKLAVLKAEQGVVAGEEDAESQDHKEFENPKEPQTIKKEIDSEAEEQSRSGGEEDAEAEALAARDEDPTILEYDKGGYSPPRLSTDDLEPGTLVITEEEDAGRLVYARAAGVYSRAAGTSAGGGDEAALAEAARGMGADEAVFSVEAPVAAQHHLWSDKYRPRKPRYFNRVHTGFEWNKYNQTHYDMDNPPPKIVQGYKFNIFYPDLIDKSSTPQYHLNVCPDNSEFSILRFHAGPPYEDIAFKIVNREWEYSYKRGFRCQFHNNIFQLWFHFKRYRYRR